jgi:hypothetical protein
MHFIPPTLLIASNPYFIAATELEKEDWGNIA